MLDEGAAYGCCSFWTQRHVPVASVVELIHFFSNHISAFTDSGKTPMSSNSGVSTSANPDRDATEPKDFNYRLPSGRLAGEKVTCSDWSLEGICLL